MNLYKPEGLILQTPENYAALSSKNGLEKAMEQHTILEGVAHMCDKSFCLHLDLGMGRRGIIPREEVEYSSKNEPTKDIAILTRVGKAVCFHVIGVSKDENGESIYVLSRKSAQRECMLHYISTLLPGDVVPAKVTHMEPFGVFMDIGCGIVSLLCIDAISVSRISHPKERFQLGECIHVAIRSKDPQGRIFVSHRELLGTWEENAAFFSPGQTVMGSVRTIESYGIFVELTPNLAGLAEWKSGITVGDRAAVFIKSILPEKMKIKLVIIDTGGNPEKTPAPSRLFLPEGMHLSHWRYSPLCCPKIIETKFDA